MKRNKLITQRRVLEMYKLLAPEQKAYVAGVMVGMAQLAKAQEGGAL